MVCSIRDIIIYNEGKGERCKESDSLITNDNSECALSQPHPIMTFGCHF